MRFDPNGFAKKLEAFEERNQRDSNLFRYFYLIDLVNRDPKIREVDFDSFTREDVESLMELLSDFEEYGSHSKRNPEGFLLHPMHEYVARYEVFAALRNPTFGMYAAEDDFI